MTHLKLDGVRKEYNDVVAVDGVDLDIRDGEFISLIGPSGCGKTTTLETISGLTKPTDGRIEIAGDDVTYKPPKDRDIAMVFQNIALFPHMSVRKNMSYGLRLKNYDSDEIEQRVQEAADILQIDGMLDRMPDELSGGQRQRVAIGRAIVMDPEVFLMDEPLANLDAKLRVHMRTELQRLQQNLNVTTVYVTHNQEEAMSMSDRIAVLNEGQIQQFAPPLECYDRPANLFVAEFIGSPTMRVFRGRIGTGSITDLSLGTEIEIPQTPDLQDGTEVLLGVRPENVYLAEHHSGAAIPSKPMTLTVDVVQPMGDELVVNLRPSDSGEPIGSTVPEEGRDTTESNQLLMTIDSDAELEAGQSVDITLDLEQVHLFDTATGEALLHGFERSLESTIE